MCNERSLDEDDYRPLATVESIEADEVRGDIEAERRAQELADDESERKIKAAINKLIDNGAWV